MPLLLLAAAWDQVREPVGNGGRLGARSRPGGGGEKTDGDVAEERGTRRRWRGKRTKKEGNGRGGATVPRMGEGEEEHECEEEGIFLT